MCLSSGSLVARIHVPELLPDVTTSCKILYLSDPLYMNPSQ